MKKELYIFDKRCVRENKNIMQKGYYKYMTLLHVKKYNSMKLQF